MKLIVIFKNGVPDLELQKQIKEKINEFHKDNLVLFGSDIDVLVMPSETMKTFKERLEEEKLKSPN